MESLAASIGEFGATVFRLAAIAFVLINGLAIAAVVITRDRSLVNRWTSRLLAADLFLIGAGAGVPIAAQALKLVVTAASASQSTEVRLNTK